MNLHDFYYDLPKELIAQTPLSDRSSSRLMVLDRKTGQVEHKVFTDIIDYLEAGDCLVLNETKVIPARLIGEKLDTKATIEVLLLERIENRGRCRCRHILRKNWRIKIAIRRFMLKMKALRQHLQQDCILQMNS